MRVRGMAANVPWVLLVLISTCVGPTGKTVDGGVTTRCRVSLGGSVGEPLECNFGGGATLYVPGGLRDVN